MEDRRLIVQCKHGNRKAFCRLYEKYRDLLFKLAISVVRDVHAAEDIVHDVFVAFAENMADFRLTGSLKTYLSVCLVNRARNHLRSKGCRNSPLNETHDRPADTVDPGNRIQCNEQLARLSDALQQLPLEQRQIIALRHYSRMRFKTIAISLEMPINTAKSRYRYGMDKLRQMMNDEVIT